MVVHWAENSAGYSVEHLVATLADSLVVRKVVGSADWKVGGKAAVMVDKLAEHSVVRSVAVWAD